ncbi:CsgG/HfaB family protein [Duganella violaceipulchra]|uniref:CsgG/HfaB family protein n=1 Tax=Duganella violaceipulchra TaxID=2849652 RepID=A0AA41H9E9_9BURK|nr:CsgG/HfaB family protein [Duganella violaceicalia]MBV6320702.1 CsgG/HfaB family protein [Duganella violaceicalia]MCP2008588.1 curli biogenesis system outer membrane secretion channel CsgG [Duganella violaceicalia]
MKNIAIASLLCVGLVACGQKQEAPAAAPPPAGPNLTQTPDVGKIEQVQTTASGTGMTPGAAINDALKTAIMQVNGTTVDAASANLNTFSQATATLDVESSYGNDSLKASATAQGSHFAEQIVTQSKGVVSSFKVAKLTPPSSKGGLYSVEIAASIAKFKAPADSGKIKIVVAPLRSSRSSFNIGGHNVPAAEVLGALRQQIIDTLSQSGRFTVLDRQFEGELQNELDMIGSGQTVNTDFAKLGQALSADLVWVGVVNDLAYDKHVRKLQTSDRDLVSYSGGWSVSQRMINLATRQILQSATLQGTAPSIAATTMGAGIDEGATMRSMQSEIVMRSAEAILLQTFPISVVERDGMTVVLSQGGTSVVENGRYKIYLQGKEIKDPQTGQSLGNMESACCEVVINRVTPKLSYGTLENVAIKLDGVRPAALQLRETVTAKAAVAVAEPAEKPKAAERKVAANRSVPAAAAGEPKKEDW